MEQKNQSKLHSGGLLVFILTVGVFGIINTEMGGSGYPASNSRNF